MLNEHRALVRVDKDFLEVSSSDAYSAMWKYPVKMPCVLRKLTDLAWHSGACLKS